MNLYKKSYQTQEEVFQEQFLLEYEKPLKRILEETH